MRKFNAKNLVITVFLGVFLLGIAGVVNAQQTLPKGGENFETAVKLESGSYEGEAIKEGAPEYFYINVKPGQELQMKGTLKGSDSSGNQTLSLYSEDREEVAYQNDYLFVGDQAPFSFSWLPNSEKDLYKYYVKRWRMIGAVSFDLSLIDRYDAGKQTDAGDSFEKAMSITPGEYKAYLSGKEGTDTKDFYKMAVKKGVTLTVRVTPPSESLMIVVVYDGNRRALESEWPPNPGAIVEASLVAKRSEDVFIEVICESGKIAAYTLNIKTETGVEAAGEGEVEVEGEGEWVLPGESIGWPTEGGLTEETIEKAAKGFFMVVIIPALIGLIVLIVIIVVIVILIRRKKKQ